MKEHVVETDVLVIGGGMAGIFAAVKAREEGAAVTLVDKGYVSKSGATAFCGGYIMVFNPEWGHDRNAWIQQISKSGEYVNNREWSEVVLQDSFARYRDLASWGVEFVKGESGGLHKNRTGVLESINMYRRVFTAPMRRHTLEIGVKILDRVMITDLIKRNEAVIGAIGFHTRNGQVFVFRAKATVVAAGMGGFKQAGLPTHFWTGDGEGMGFRAGAEISGKEFGGGGFGGIAAYPAWRGHGMAFSKHWKFAGSEGDPIDHTAMYYGNEAAIHEGRGPVLWDLDVATPEDVKSMLHHQASTGTLTETRRAGLDLAAGGKVPILGSGWLGASIQGGMGGLWAIDTHCATTLPGLYAAGDSCSTRQVGARYPATGFAIGHAAVTGARAGKAASQYASTRETVEPKIADLERLKTVLYDPMNRPGGFSPAWITRQIQNYMVPYYIWQIKQGERMKAMETMLEFVRDHLVPKLKAHDPHELRMAHETRNMALNADLMLKAASFRTESRGMFYREDYPQRRDPEWLAWVKVKAENGKPQVWKEPIPEAWWPDLTRSYQERYPMKYPGQ
jgi:succinate dehydrogenase/fumarate reductase flavoprotein subunit